MFMFSKLHAAQNDTAVMQILVFTSLFAQSQFEQRYSDNVNNSPEGAEASDTGLGVAYKLRAVLDSNGRRVAIIRCGFSGILLWEGYVKYDSITKALEAGLGEIKRRVIDLNLDFS